MGQKLVGTGNVSAEMVSLVEIDDFNAMIVTVSTNSTQPPPMLTQTLEEPIATQFAEYSDIIQNVSFVVRNIARFGESSPGYVKMHTYG